MQARRAIGSPELADGALGATDLWKTETGISPKEVDSPISKEDTTKEQQQDTQEQTLNSIKAEIANIEGLVEHARECGLNELLPTLRYDLRLAQAKLVLSMMLSTDRESRERLAEQFRRLVDLVNRAVVMAWSTPSMMLLILNEFLNCA